MQRRTMIMATAGLGAMLSAHKATAMGEPNSAAPSAVPRARTFVLVHGAWHGGWCWRDVANILRSNGHKVLTPTMTGLGERHHLARRDTDMNTHIQDILNVLKFEEASDVILVGHSYGGPVAEAVHDQAAEQIDKVVMLDAVVLDEGRSNLSRATPEMIAGVKKTLIDGFMLPSWPVEAFGVLPSDGDVYDWVKRRLTSMPFACLETPLTLSNGGLKGPGTLYVSCDGRPFGDGSKPGLEAAKSRGWSTASLDTGHDAMVTAPKALAELLMEQI